MDEVINDIQTESTGLDETTVEVPLIEEPKAKAKAKRKPKAVAVEEPLAPPPTPEPAQEAKPEPAVAEKECCPDCGKMVSSKTLKYSHKANCKLAKTTAPEEPKSAPSAPQNDIFGRLALVKQARLEKKMSQYAKLTSQIV